jgi:hypothetical protein
MHHDSSISRPCFVPFSEALVARTGMDLGPLVPFQPEYHRCDAGICQVLVAGPAVEPARGMHS